LTNPIVTINNMLTFVLESFLPIQEKPGVEKQYLAWTLWRNINPLSGMCDLSWFRLFFYALWIACFRSLL